MHSLLPILLLCSCLPLVTGGGIGFSPSFSSATARDGTVYSYCPSDTDTTGNNADQDQQPVQSTPTAGGDSAFAANLDVLLASLPSAAAAASRRFATNTTGTNADQVYGLAQCRADVVNASDCLACLDGTVQTLATNCSGQKDAILIKDMCLMRHSSANFFGSVDTSSKGVYWANGHNATQPAQFRSLLGALMDNLTNAAYQSPLLFAAGSVALTPFENIYGMAQCTRDLAANDCNRCLVDAVRAIPTCCDGRQGGQVVYQSCAIRFEVYLFYNVKGAEAAMSPAPPAPAPGVGSVNGSEHSSPGSNGSSHAVRTALLVSIPVALALLMLLVAAVYLCKRNNKAHKHMPIATVSDEEIRSSEFLLYDLSTLRAATGNFSEENKLGEGGFGTVYKGMLRDGQEIAVKRLSASSQQGQVEMKNEVVLLAKLQHRNLVRLLGCCIEEHERLLVYEFLTNNSLDKTLFDPARQQELGWGPRQRIIEGIGRGLLYLHEDSRLTIIHRDLKASNILLDADMNPKISDFGLAKLFSIDSSVGNTSRIAGTYGYMAPEYALHGIFSAKSDIFSYGVLVLEIVTGRRNSYMHALGPSEDLLSYVWRHWSRGNVQPLLEGCPDEGLCAQEMLRCIHIGLLCVQEDPHLRPSMASVVVMLNSRSITLSTPTAPAFTMPGHGLTVAAEGVLVTGTDRQSARAVAAGRGHSSSINEASFSDLEPR